MATSKDKFILCPLRCENCFVPRGELQTHVLNNCTSMNKGICPYKPTGCPFQGSKDELNKHLVEKKDEHMFGLLVNNRKQRKQITDLKKQIHSLMQQRNKQLENLNCQLEHQNVQIDQLRSFVITLKKKVDNSGELKDDDRIHLECLNYKFKDITDFKPSRFTFHQQRNSRYDLPSGPRTSTSPQRPTQDNRRQNNTTTTQNSASRNTTSQNSASRNNTRQNNTNQNSPRQNTASGSDSTQEEEVNWSNVFSNLTPDEQEAWMNISNFFTQQMEREQLAEAGTIIRSDLHWRLNDVVNKMNRPNQRQLSPSFIIPEGYRLQIIAHLNGVEDERCFGISLYVQVLHGPNDHTLDWPLKATLKVKLYNPENPEDAIYYYSNASDKDHLLQRCLNRIPTVSSVHQIVSHAEVFENNLLAYESPEQPYMDMLVEIMPE